MTAICAPLLAPMTNGTCDEVLLIIVMVDKPHL